VSDPAGGTMESATMARVNRRLLPFLFLLYIVCFIDRTNVSFAALQMNRDVGLSDAVYGLGAGVFFLGYADRYKEGTAVNPKIYSDPAYLRTNRAVFTKIQYLFRSGGAS